MKTFVATPSNIERQRLVIDAEGKTLGRLADTGDYVIVVNASKMVLTGKKLDQKLYRHHSGFPGGMTEIDYKTMMEKKPEKVLELAVKGMLPKNSLGRQMFRKLHVYAGPEHEQAAQKPVEYTFEQ